jgi:WD40 repeat protein
LNTELYQLKHAKEWVEEIRYSPDGSKLAIGSHDNFIYLYRTQADGKYKAIGKCRGHSSFITCIDWSLDCNTIRSVCGAYELLFFNTETAEQWTSGASGTVDTVWADHAAKFGWRVDGIFTPGTDGSHVNSVAQS